MAAAAGPLCVAVAGLLLGTGVPFVRERSWPTPTTNLAEAAALRDGARVRVLVAAGARLDEPMPVRPGLLDDAPARMTPMEAAVASGSDDMVSLLVELGAPRGSAAAGR